MPRKQRLGFGDVAAFRKALPLPVVGLGDWVELGEVEENGAKTFIVIINTHNHGFRCLAAQAWLILFASCWSRHGVMRRRRTNVFCLS